MEQKYSGQSGMESAVKRWKSPHKLTGDPDKPAGAVFYDKSKENKKAQKEKYKNIDKKEAKEKGINHRTGQGKTERQAKRDEKKAYMQTDEGKAERRAKTTDTVQSIGRAMMAYAGLKPGEAEESATEKLEKERAKEPSYE